MRGYSSREILRMLYNDGWLLFKTTGDHWHFKHPTKPGKVTVPHPEKDLPAGTVKAIVKQAGIVLL